jgi:hypothetical protein
MILCSFNRLLQLLDRLLEVDEQLEAYDHLDQCEICRDTIYQLSRDRDQALFIYPGALRSRTSPRTYRGSGKVRGCVQMIDGSS